MLLIKTLGGLAVYDGARALSGAAQQPRRLAILALLARAGDRGVSRDRLLAMLWPEADEERARRGLNQALYALRQDLGSEDAITGNRDLRLDNALVDSDVRLFTEERAAGRFEAAAERWGGPFLSGFNLPGVPEFERWMESERAALAHDYAELLETLAIRAAERKDLAGAVPWWRRLAALDPLNARNAEGLMRAQAAAGDEAGALRQAEIFAAFYEAEFGVAPDPRIGALADRIRRGELRAAAETVIPAPVRRSSSRWRDVTPRRHQLPAPPVRAPAPLVARAVPTAIAGDAGAITVTSGWAAVALPSRPGRRAHAGAPALTQSRSGRRRCGWVLRWRRSRRWRWRPACGAAPRALPKPGALPVLAVGRIVDYTRGTSGDRSAPLSDMLATNLARVPGLEVVSTSRMLELVAQFAREGDTSSSAVSRAARVAGATEVIDGALYEVAPGRFRLDLRRVDLATRQRARCPRDRRCRPLRAGRQRHPGTGGARGRPRAAGLARRGEHPLGGGVCGVLRGPSRLLPGRPARRTAALQFRRARKTRSFAMAQFYLARTETDLGRLLDAMERARRLSTSAPPREGLIIRAAWAFYQDDPSFRAVAETLSVNYPAEVAGHLWYGQALTRTQQYSAAVPMFLRVIAMDSLGLKGSSAECLACEAYQAITYSYLALDSLPAAERMARRWVAGQPDSPTPYAVLADLLQPPGPHHRGERGAGAGLESRARRRHPVHHRVEHRDAGGGLPPERLDPRAAPVRRQHQRAL